MAKAILFMLAEGGMFLGVIYSSSATASSRIPMMTTAMNA